MTTAAPKPRRRLARRLVVVAVLLAIVPVVSIGFALVDVNRTALRERSEELLFAVTDDVARQTAGALDNARAQLGTLALILGAADEPIELRLQTARAFVAAGDLGAVAIFDEHGTRIDAITATGATWRGDEVVPAEVREAATRDGFAIGTVEVIDDEARVPIVMPIQGRAARWYVSTLVSLAPLADLLLGLVRDRFAGRFDGVTVIDDQLRFIVHVDPEQRLSTARQLQTLAGIDASAIRSGILVFRDTDTKRGGTFGVVRSLPGLPWAVVAQMPREQVYAPLERARRLILIAVASATVLALLAAIVLARRATRPIDKLVTLAHDLGQRKFDRRIDVKTGDELETLAHAMTAAASDLEASERRLRDEAEIRTQLRRYLPAKLVERIVTHDADEQALAGRRRKITVVFADIAGFTALAEREPPDRVVALLNQLFTVLTEIVFRHGGTIDKLIGDCLMAFWGAPDDQPDHARRAVAAAIDMQRWLDVANDCWETSLGLTVHLAIGVHTGEAVVGNLGSDARMEYTCVGDTVNVAARLEALARPQQILISEATRAELDPGVRCARIGKRQLPGRMAAVELHEVVL